MRPSKRASVMYNSHTRGFYFVIIKPVRGAEAVTSDGQCHYKEKGSPCALCYIHVTRSKYYARTAPGGDAIHDSGFRNALCLTLLVAAAPAPAPTQVCRRSDPGV